MSVAGRDRLPRQSQARSPFGDAPLVDPTPARHHCPAVNTSSAEEYAGSASRGSLVSGPEQLQCRMLTARAITRSDVTRAATLSTLIRNLAREESGMVSVGLKAVELVTDT